MSDDKKLTDQELTHIKDCQEELYPAPDEEESRLMAIRDVGRLLDHIDLVQAEFDALVESADNLIDEKDTRIEALEVFVGAMRKTVFDAENNHHLATNWATASIEKAIEQLDEKTKILDEKANRPGMEPER